MSYPSLCVGCAMGDHARHVRAHGIRPGLIGGTYCPCAGDCKAPDWPFAAASPVPPPKDER